MNQHTQDAQEDGYLREPIGFTRRRFFAWLGWGSLTLAGNGLALGAGAYIFPRLTLEPPQTYAVGRPSDYAVGEMNLIESYRVFIFRTSTGFQAVSAICTHLGCTYKPYGKQDENYQQVHAHCPCHGSVFHRNGSVLKGPAPRPLPFYALSLSPDGRLVVDESVHDGSSWAGIDHRLYLTEDGRQVQGALPEGEDLDFS